jgi:hypothetical protein
MQFCKISEPRIFTDPDNWLWGNEHNVVIDTSW